MQFDRRRQAIHIAYSDSDVRGPPTSDPFGPVLERPQTSPLIRWPSSTDASKFQKSRLEGLSSSPHNDVVVVVVMATIVVKAKEHFEEKELFQMASASCISPVLSMPKQMTAAMKLAARRSDSHHSYIFAELVELVSSESRVVMLYT
ncbi:hypothetical protein F4810DRAFT_712188 [Camillea tinctor]|nr:hypothetical protein F4810DRAFT_712188 [Camillea tinctor]